MAMTSVLDENGKIRLEMEEEGETALIRPVGVIDEDVNFSVILDTLTKIQPTMKNLQFDMGHISRMNSCGVREWILLMERLGNAVSCSFMNVNELFVEQANMIPGMFGRKGTPVLSFHAPYHCPKCNCDVTVLLRPRDVTFDEEGPKAPDQKCKQCQAPLEFDWIEEEYFDFIKRL